MTVFLALGSRVDLDEVREQAARGERPRHAMGQLAELTDATVVSVRDVRPNLFDRIAARLVGTPQAWALARRLRKRVRPGDVIYCPDEAVGFPVAALCSSARSPNVMMTVHNIVRPRAKLAMRLLGLKKKAYFTAVSSIQIAYLRDKAGVPSDRLLYVSDQTDLRFFRPGAPAAHSRKVVMSVGLEQRDYRTLAEATGDLPVDIRISGFSADAAAIRNAFPETIPANMEQRYYEWRDLLALYQSADVMVVSLFPNTYAAGIQTLLEAIACRTPVVVTRTEGLAEYLEHAPITTVPVGDPPALRAAILGKLADPVAAKTQAEAIFDAFRDRIDSDTHVRALADQLAVIGRRPG